jgi:hypothetical protein
MANGHTNLQATDASGTKLSLQHTSTDSPILPAANLKELQLIDPSLVGWVIRETEVEATHRRTESSRINKFVFIERMSGVVAATLATVLGFVMATYMVLQGHDWAGVAIGGGTLVTIVTVLVQHNKKSLQESITPAPAKRTSRRK